MVSGGESPCLYVVATPIGHLDDITLRAVNVLKSVATIAAEDTRHTRHLLQHHGIEGAVLMSLHDHNESEVIDRVLARLAVGDVALVSDAGTPLISDPGFALVRAARKAGFVVTPLPGPSAVMAALSVSDIPVQNFMFIGFLPAKKSALEKRLQEISVHAGAVVFFEAPHRVLATIEAIARLMPERQLMVARELTKLHETVLSGKAADVLPALEAEHRGEFVVVVEGAEEATSLEADALIHELAGLLPPRTVARVVAKLCGGKSRSWYEAIQNREG